jgi:tellurite resistance protein
LQTIEALAPGLYEMHIDDILEKDGRKHFTVSFSERTLDDIRALDDGFDDERPFAAVARASEIQSQIYDSAIRPLVKASVPPAAAELSRALHPQRLTRALASSHNPLIKPVAEAAQKVKSTRQKASVKNPYISAEALWVQSTTQMIDYWRDCRDMAYELTFHSVWGTPWARSFGRTHEARRTLKSNDELRSLPEVLDALERIKEGGFAEAVIRMLVLLAENRGQVRRDRLERSNRVLTLDEPFKSLGSQRRADIIYKQTLIATFEPEHAIEALPHLLPKAKDRELALKVVQYIPGSIQEMSPKTLALLQRFREVLELPPLKDEVTEDPLSN